MERSRTLARDVGYVEGETQALVALVRLSVTVGQCSEAMTYASAARERSLLSSRESDRLTALLSLVQALQCSGRGLDARLAADEALQFARRVRGPLLVDALMNAGFCEAEWGTWDRAQSYFSEARQLASRLGDVVRNAAATNSLMEFGSLTQHAPTPLGEQRSEMTMMQGDLMNLTSFQARQVDQWIGQSDKALAQALGRELLETIDKMPCGMSRTHLLARVAFRAAEHSLWDLAEITLAKYSGERVTGLSASLRVLAEGMVVLGRGNRAGASFVLRQLMAMTQEPSQLPSPPVFQHWLVKYGELSGQPMDEEYERLLDILEAERQRQTSEPWRGAVLELQEKAYRDVLSHLIRSRRMGRAVEVAEASRARALQDLLEGRSATEEGVAGLPVPGSMSAHTGRQDRLRRLSVQLPVLKPSSIVSGLPLSEIRAVAGAGTVVLFHLFVGGVAILAVEASGEPKVRFLEIPRDQLQHLVEETTVLIARSGLPDETRTAGDPLGSRLRRFYDLLIAPIADLRPTGAAAPILIVPQGALFRVPFDALLGPDGKFLCERFTITQAPSVGVARALARKSIDPAAPAVLFGNPAMPDPPLWPALPEAGEEVEAVGKLRVGDPTPSRVFRGPAATEAAFRREAPAAGILHVATHGYVETIDPRRSVLVLAPTGDTPEQDGYVTVADVMSMNLQARLVVLSACRSGLGPISAEGVAGFQRAFFAAGARSLLLSLWDVADRPTARFMTAFHRSFATRADTAGAARDARLSMLREQAPLREWAGFVAVGAYGR